MLPNCRDRALDEYCPSKMSYEPVWTTKDDLLAPTVRDQLGNDTPRIFTPKTPSGFSQQEEGKTEADFSPPLSVSHSRSGATSLRSSTRSMVYNAIQKTSRDTCYWWKRIPWVRVVRNLCIRRGVCVEANSGSELKLFSIDIRNGGSRYSTLILHR